MSLSHIDTTLHVVSCLSVSLPPYEIHSHVFSLSRCVSLSHGKRDKQRHIHSYFTHSPTGDLVLDEVFSLSPSLSLVIHCYVSVLYLYPSLSFLCAIDTSTIRLSSLFVIHVIQCPYCCCPFSFPLPHLWKTFSFTLTHR